MKVQSRFIEMFAGKYQTKPLSDFIESSFPGEWGTDDANNTGTKVIRTTNFTNEGRIDYTNVVTRQIDANKIKKKKLQHGDIILERSGGTNENPVGRVVLFNEDGTYIFNNFTQLLRPIEDVNNIYLFYSLFNYYHLNKHQIRSMGAKTTGIQNLNMELYMKNPIYDAPMDVQDSFATIFEQADKSKFVGFKSRFIEMFGDPVSWQTDNSLPTLNDTVNVISGFPFDSEKFDTEGVGTPLIRIRDIQRGYSGTFTTEAFDEQYRIKKYELLVGMDGMFDIARWQSDEAALNQRVCCLRMKGSENDTFIQYLVQPILKHIENGTNATTVKHISTKQINGIRVPIASHEQKNKFAMIANQADKSKYYYQIA